MTILDDLNERIPDSVRWAFIVIVMLGIAAGIAIPLLLMLR